MKKTYVYLIMVVFLAFAIGGPIVSKAKAEAIGYVDVQRVFKEFEATAKAQEELAKEEEEFKQEFEERRKKLEEAEEEGKTEEELEELQKELEEELSPKRERLLELNERLTTELQKEILGAVEKVAKKVGIDVVVDKQVIIVGGTDLTDFVINELNK